MVNSIGYNEGCEFQGRIDAPKRAMRDRECILAILADSAPPIGAPSDDYAAPPRRMATRAWSSKQMRQKIETLWGLITGAPRDVVKARKEIDTFETALIMVENAWDKRNRIEDFETYFYTKHF